MIQRILFNIINVITLQTKNIGFDSLLKQPYKMSNFRIIRILIFNKMSHISCKKL